MTGDKLIIDNSRFEQVEKVWELLDLAITDAEATFANPKYMPDGGYFLKETIDKTCLACLAGCMLIQSSENLDEVKAIGIDEFNNLPDRINDYVRVLDSIRLGFIRSAVEIFYGETRPENYNRSSEKNWVVPGMKTATDDFFKTMEILKKYLQLKDW